MRWLFISIAAALVVAAAATAQSATVPGSNGKLLFQHGSAGNPFGPTTQIWTVAASGKHLTRLTTGKAYNGNAAWSPNGKKIAFESTRGGDIDIWVMDANGKHADAVTFSQGYDGNPAWSPDGTKIVFETDRLGTGNQRCGRDHAAGIDDPLHHRRCAGDE